MNRILRIASDFTLPIDAVTQTFAILAKRGVGKTYTGAVLTEELLDAGQQVVVADPVGVWWGLRSSADGKEPGFPIVVFGGEHADVPLQEEAGEVVAQSVVEHGFSAVLDLSLLRKAAQVRFMTAFAEALYRLNRKPLHVMVDEADAFAPQRPMRGEERLLGAFEDIVRRGRARGLGVTLITQRAAVLNKNVLTQIEVLVCLRTISPQDREAIAAWTEIHGTEKQLETFNESLPSLPIGTAWFWSPGWLDIFQRVKVRSRRTFDSSATPEAGKHVAAPKRVAEIDLTALGDKIQATVAKAKENDPALLKRKLAEARQELKKLRDAPAPKQSKPAVTVFKHILRDGQLARVEKLIERFGQRLEQAKELAAEITAQSEDIADAIKSTTVTPRPAPQFLAKPLPKSVVLMKPPPSTHFPNGDRRELSGGLLEILKAAAQHPDGVTDEQISVLTGYRKTSRTTYKQKLMAAGYLSRGGRGYVATEDGIAALGNDYEPLPTGNELREHWLRRLSGGELALFRKFVEVFPLPVSNEQLMESTQYKKTSIVTYKQKLSARNLIVAAPRGEASAAKELFDDDP